MNYETIYGTLECSAWSMGFDYEEYLSLCDKTEGFVARRLTLRGYEAFCNVMETEMMLDWAGSAAAEDEDEDIV